jgi:hypothetical protein
MRWIALPAWNLARLSTKTVLRGNKFDAFQTDPAELRSQMHHIGGTGSTIPDGTRSTSVHGAMPAVPAHPEQATGPQRATRPTDQLEEPVGGRSSAGASSLASEHG